MKSNYYESKIIENVDFSSQSIFGEEYESCVFKNCNFSNSKLHGNRFYETEFLGCNLSNVELLKSSFQDVRFNSCKMIGMHFDKCNPFGFAIFLNNCQLNHSIFYRMNLSKSSFLNSNMEGVDFTEADLKTCVLQNCDLLNVVFNKTNLERADLRTSFNYSIDPENNTLRKAKFSIAGIGGLLDKYGIEVE